MAIRNIRKYGDELLRKKSRKIEKIDDRILTLLEDMAETMYSAEGVGLAAPQVGILKRVVVIDVGEGLIKLINPEIIETEGSQKDVEGCLSVPGEQGEGEELLARAFCHEIDHLDGVLFVDKVING